MARALQRDGAHARARADARAAEPVAVQLAELRREVRASAEQAYREAGKTLHGRDLHASLRRVLESWIGASCARQKVVCFACAAEHDIRLDTRSQEACSRAARESSALHALYWAAHRRFHPHEAAAWAPRTPR